MGSCVSHSHRSAGGGWWWLVPRRRHAPEAKRESQATSGVPRRTRPTGTIQSCSRAGWNATAHHTSTPAPASPTAATPAATAQHAHDHAHPASAPDDGRPPPPRPAVSMAAASALAPRDPCSGAIAIEARLAGLLLLCARVRWGAEEGERGG